ncbi:hypothetical protein FJZ26_03540 [Candidatus Parvarchaeota archaeon]|nr:hypothetical protein [Candidatus Parvarchaeota archaeon]
MSFNEKIDLKNENPGINFAAAGYHLMLLLLLAYGYLTHQIQQYFWAAFLNLFMFSAILIVAMASMLLVSVFSLKKSKKENRETGMGFMVLEILLFLLLVGSFAYAFILRPSQQGGLLLALMPLAALFAIKETQMQPAKAIYCIINSITGFLIGVFGIFIAAYFMTSKIAHMVLKNDATKHDNKAKDKAKEIGFLAPVFIIPLVWLVGRYDNAIGVMLLGGLFYFSLAAGYMIMALSEILQKHPVSIVVYLIKRIFGEMS